MMLKLAMRIAEDLCLPEGVKNEIEELIKLFALHGMDKFKESSENARQVFTLMQSELLAR